MVWFGAIGAVVTALLTLKGRYAFAALTAAGVATWIAIQVSGRSEMGRMLVPVAISLPFCVGMIFAAARPGSWWFRRRYDDEKREAVLRTFLPDAPLHLERRDAAAGADHARRRMRRS